MSLTFLIQGTGALAATTGGIAGVVHDNTGAPIAGATVTATSPSQTATTTTDAQGHFVFLVLEPDTYTLTVTKDGYQTTSLAGNTVFADQTQQVSLTAPRAIKVIAHVTGTAAGLVKPGVSGDLYNVTPAQSAAAAALGGGGNLNFAYSAISAVPGVYLGAGETNWAEPVVIHGENPYFTAYELEGIPVNRAFDNYPNSTVSNLGLQELQIYTGGGPADISSNGVSGFINTVIKTGTFPGYADLTVGAAGEAFWHEATLEVGGATPDHNFSYYVGISGFDQSFRYINNANGAPLTSPGNIYQDDDPYFTELDAVDRGVEVDCSDPYNLTAPGAPLSNGCMIGGWGEFGETTLEADREDIINLHLGIPRQDGQRDDLQLFYDESLMESSYNADPAAIGPGLEEGLDYLGYGDVDYFGSTPPYVASYNYNLPFGTNVDPGGVPIRPTLYGQPGEPESVFADGCAGQSDTMFSGAFPTDTCSLPENSVAQENIEFGALKLQWTHPFTSSSYVRVYAYSLYSGWSENDPLGAAVDDYFLPAVLYEGAELPDFEQDTHTVGGSIAYANQLTDTNLLSFEANIATANDEQYDNYYFDSYFEGGSEIGLIAESNGKYSCYNPSTMASEACYLEGYGSGLTSEQNYYVGEPAISGAAAAAGAQYETLWNGNTFGNETTLRPLFYNFSIQDEWRPNDHWLFDAALRFDNFTEELPNGVNPEDNFEAQIIDDDVCWNPTLGVLTYPLTPGEFPPPQINYETTCPTETIGTKTYNFIHPPFTDANETGNSYTTYDWEPRFGFTYTKDPDTVWTFSAGRHAQPINSVSDQLLFAGGGSLASETWADYLNQGFFTPEHELPNMTQSQYNGSFEHRFRGTNISMKISPFYSETSNWQQDDFIQGDLVTQLPTGLAKNYGVEFSLQDGDFAANGLSAMLSFTWTQALVKYQPLLGLNQIEQMNTQIENYNSLTKKGGGFPCYIAGTTTGTTLCGASNATDTVTNPYYDMAPQPTLNINGWYPQGVLAMSAPAQADYSDWYNAPYVTSLIFNWRQGRFAVTPSIQVQSGTPYGSPLDVVGVDPRDCAMSQNAAGVVVGNYACDYLTAGVGAGPYGYLNVPNPQTGTFASPGEYTDPNIAIANLELSYDFPHVTVTLTLTDLYHACFGGSTEPWTAAYPPNGYTCGYFPNYNYNGAGFYNGTSPYDKAANGVTPYAWEEQSYYPDAEGDYDLYLPFNFYVQAKIHI